MIMQPSDYLADLNLDFDRSNVSPVEEVNTADLDLFTQTEFFDLDVFSSDFTPPTKDQMKVRASEADLGSFEHFVKPEPSEHSVAQFDLPSTPYLNGTDLELPKQTEVNEIKRKRNTAASARFRVKKKLKEKQMEEQARKLQEKLSALEKKLRTLEMENKCLKQLILEKNEKKNCDLLDSIKKRTLGGDAGFTFTN